MKFIELTKGCAAIVDDADFEDLSKTKWCVRDTNMTYAVRGNKVGKKSFITYMHRQIMNAQKGQIVDHINRNPLDNRRENLRFCTIRQNSVNSKPRKNRYGRGVYLDNKRKLFCANIRDGKNKINLGYFKTVNDAQDAYDKKSVELNGEFAVTNKSLLALKKYEVKK